MDAWNPLRLRSVLTRGTVLVFLCLAFAVTTPSPGEGARCGGEGQAPCKVWERIPSCDRGLVEDFSKGRCVKPPQQRVAPPPPTPAASPCGREGQRPCKLTERVPSCNQGLVEDFAHGRCIRRAAEPAPSPCGLEGQRPCLVTERIPSCDRGLVEDMRQGRCITPAVPASLSCGRLGQRPCLVTERIPSCDRGLAEDFAQNRCITPPAPAHPPCGREGQRPCLVVERIPSCDPALYEDFKEGRCRPLPPGKTPWSASFDSMNEGLKGLGAVCSSFFNNAGSAVVRGLHSVPVVFQAPPVARESATLVARANLRFGTGFLCGIWPYAGGLLQELAFAANTPKLFEATATDAQKRLAGFVRDFQHAYMGSPCSGLSPIGVRPLCSLVKALPAEAAGQCMSGLMKKVESELSATAETARFHEARYLDAMEGAGNMAYEAALDAVIGVATAGASEAVKSDKLERIKKVYDFLQDLREAFGSLQRAQQGVDAMTSELSAVPACRALL